MVGCEGVGPRFGVGLGSVFYYLDFRECNTLGPFGLNEISQGPFCNYSKHEGPKL